MAPVRVAPSPSIVSGIAPVTPTAGVPLGVIADVGIIGLDGRVRACGLSAGLLGVLGRDLGDGQGGDESERGDSLEHHLGGFELRVVCL